LLGALGATLVATEVIAAPGLVLFATGPVLAALRGALAGAAAGYEVGALAGLGIWKDEAHIHADALERGGIVVAVPAEHEHAEHARKVFAAAGADEVRG
jgi:predicted O-methyltransferase YrrM